jgi:hypothetical protein
MKTVNEILEHTWNSDEQCFAFAKVLLVEKVDMYCKMYDLDRNNLDHRIVIYQMMSDNTNYVQQELMTPGSDNEYEFKKPQVKLQLVVDNS